ncbi:MAG: YjcZ family sporulation protein [Turicibacter sp.]
MYNYGTGCNYNYGGYTGGYGYGCGAQPVAYPCQPTGGNACGLGLILVLFILLVIIGCGSFNGCNTGCGNEYGC